MISGVSFECVDKMLVFDESTREITINFIVHVLFVIGFVKASKMLPDDGSVVEGIFDDEVGGGFDAIW